MNICVISPSYPTQGKQYYPFVENLCNKWADMGNNVFVITPVSKTKRLLRKKKKYPYSQISYKSDNGTVTVYIDGKPYEVSIVDGDGVLNVTLGVGEHDVNVTLSDDSNYTDTNKVTSFNVSAKIEQTSS